MITHIPVEFPQMIIETSFFLMLAKLGFDLALDYAAFLVLGQYSTLIGLIDALSVISVMKRSGLKQMYL